MPDPTASLQTSDAPIDQIVDGVATPRAEYSRHLDKWTRCRDVVSGSDEVKNAGQRYLPRLSGQSETDYQAYKMRALWYGGTARTRDALAGTLFREPPQVKLPDSCAVFEEDATLSDVPFEAFALTTVEHVLDVGRYGVLVDYPVQQTGEARPYLIGFRAEDILNWRVTVVNGRAYLTLLVLRECLDQPLNEFETREQVQYSVLRLTNPGLPGAVYSVTKYAAVPRKDVAGKDSMGFRQVGFTIPRRRGTPLSFIPFSFIGPSSLHPHIVKPPLLDLVEVNVSLYRTSADLEHGRHFTALPTPWIAGAPHDNSPLVIGSSRAWLLNDNGRAGFLEFRGQGLKALEKAVAEKLEQMAVLGARMVEAHSAGTGQPETAEAVRQRHAATHATLRTIGNTTSLALTKALRWMAWWDAKTADVDDQTISVTLNKEYVDTRLSSDELKTLLLAVQAEKISYETFYYRLTVGGWARMGVTAEQEKAQIRLEAPYESPPIELVERGVQAKRADSALYGAPDVGAPGTDPPPAKTGGADGATTGGPVTVNIHTHGDKAA